MEKLSFPMLENIKIPEFVRVHQAFADEKITDIPKAVFDALAPYANRIRPGMSVCLTCGSRGIDNYAAIIRAAADYCKANGAVPFAVPAMGSHGGATAEGQVALLAALGITEKSIGCPIRATMDTVLLDTAPDGRQVRIDANAAGADGILVINRIKLHTSFRGTVESGLLKMMAVGLGKQVGAQACHSTGYLQMSETVRTFGGIILEKAPILMGLGVIENAFDHTCRIHGIAPEHILAEEPKLLQAAAALMPSLGFTKCDVLVVDESGKNISGTGMDPNITGAFGTPGMSGGLQAQRRCVLSLSEAAHGNGHGIGVTDAITRRIFDSLDLQAMYTNAATATSLAFSRIPLVMGSDREAIALCIHACTGEGKTNPKIIRIKNTLSLADFEISTALIPDLPANIQVVSQPYCLPFDENGNLF